MVFFQIASQDPLEILVRSKRHALSMQIYAGWDSSVGNTCSKNANIFVGDSDLANFAHAITTPHGVHIVSI